MKKNFKTVLSIVSVLAIALGAFSGCGKEDAEPAEGVNPSSGYSEEAVNEVNSETSIEEVTSEVSEASTEAAESKTEATTKKSETESKLLSADIDDDDAKLAGFMEYVFGCGGGYNSEDPSENEDGYTAKEFFDFNYRDYDSISKDALDFAFGNMYGRGCYNFTDALSDIYGLKLDNYCTVYDGENIPRDPQKKFEEGQAYLAFDGNEFDKLLKEIFNVNPDHGVEKFTSDDGETFTEAYYSDGKYYILLTETGDGNPRVLANEMKETSDGKYNISIAYQPEAYVDDFEHYNVVAGLKNIDGKRIWSIYSIKKA